MTALLVARRFRSAAMAALLGGALSAQVLVYPSQPEIQQSISIVQAIVAATNPNPMCVALASYDSTWPSGAMRLLLGNSTVSFCPPNPGWVHGQVQAFVQSHTPAIRAGIFFVLRDDVTGASFVLPHPSHLVPGCCLVPYGTTANAGWLAATGSSARGGTLWLSMRNPQSAAARGFVFLARRPDVLQLPEGVLLLDPGSLIDWFAVGSAGNSMPITVPNLTALVGLDLYFQSAFVDAASPESLRLSNGLIVTIT